MTPLTLTLSSRKPRTIAGEGVVLDVRIEVSSELAMETVQLNRSRTKVLVNDDVLTGEDYMRLHQHHPLQPVGTAFKAPAGSAWTVQLELLRYARPLPVGKYRVAISYRFGPEEADVVQSNAVELEVAAAEPGTVEDRWLGGANPRDRLSSLWTSGARWIYQVARAHDPGVVETASDLEMPPVTALTAPRPAQLNDIAAMHWERFVYWREPGGLGWVKVHPYGRASDPRVLPLDGAMLVEPALQSRAGALHALWLGAGSVSWVQIDGQGRATSRSFPLGLPLRAAAVWGRAEDTVTLFLLEAGGKLRTVRLPDGEQSILQETKGAPLELVVDQWMGLASVHLVTQEREERLRIARWDVDGATVSPGAGWTVPLVEGGQLRQAVPQSDGLALLFERPGGWTVCTADRRAEISPPGALSLPARLVADKGVHFVVHEPARGFSALPVFE